MEIILTRHAEEQMVERDISLEQIEKTIRWGSKTRQTDGWLSIYSCIAAAYKITKNNECKIKTVMIV